MLFDNSKIKGVRTLVKFRINHDAARSRNRIITTTLGKFGFINAQYRGECPNDEEFWIVEIDSVIIKNHPVSGIFILTPIHKVERDGYQYITHGLYTYEDDQGIRYVKPKIEADVPWLMSIEDRRLLMQPEIHAIIVVNGHASKADTLSSAVANATNGFVQTSSTLVTGRTTSQIDQEIQLNTKFGDSHE